MSERILPLPTPAEEAAWHERLDPILSDLELYEPAQRRRILLDWVIVEACAAAERELDKAPQQPYRDDARNLILQIGEQLAAAADGLLAQWQSSQARAGAKPA